MPDRRITPQMAQHIKDKASREAAQIRADGNKRLTGAENKRLKELKDIKDAADAVIRGDGRKKGR